MPNKQPSSNLDDKLKEIFKDSDLMYSHATEVLIAQIKQAFAEEGYFQVEVNGKIYTHNLNDNRLTGQEWYDRFEKEVVGRDWHVADILPAPQTEAARKASGIK
jgi:hypothetical protein